MTLPELALPAVSLPEVLGGWALQNREDRKYLLPIEVIFSLMGGRQADYSVLEIGGRRSFGYHTHYFDTPDLLTYRDHAQGVRRRFKVRIRRYLDSDLTRLEVKSKGVRSRTVKHALDGADRLDAAAQQFLRQSLDSAYGPDYRPEVVPTLRPGLAMSYQRTTLISTAGERVTVDTDLRIYHADLQAELHPDLALLEVKSAGSRSDTDRDLVMIGHRPLSFSKYVAGVELTTGRPRRHRPGLLRTRFSVRPLEREQPQALSA